MPISYWSHSLRIAWAKPNGRSSGVRPIERAWEEHPTPENDAIRGSCRAVQASLTDDGRSPLDAPGLHLSELMSQISNSLGRV